MGVAFWLALHRRQQTPLEAPLVPLVLRAAEAWLLAVWLLAAEAWLRALVPGAARLSARPPVLRGLLCGRPVAAVPPARIGPSCGALAAAA